VVEMDTNTFIWSVIGALVVAGLGFGAKKTLTKNSIKNSQVQIGDNNKGNYKSKNITEGSDRNVQKDEN
jgi:hypothetical protein